ncbi:MAG: DUF6962 family protein [Thermoanaerobaculia bacterium]
MATDYALAAASLAAAALLWRAGRGRGRISIRLWAMAFLSTAFATLLGGTYHGFHDALDDTGRAILWKLTVYCVGLADLSLLAGAAVASGTRPVAKWILSAAVVKFAVYAVWMRSHDDFRYVISDYGCSMAGVLLLELYAYWKGRGEHAGWVVAGVLVSFAAAAVQKLQITISEHFNHNDLYHVIQLGALYLLYRGGLLLKDHWTSGKARVTEP